MPSLLPGYEYDIFISYRHKDNKGEWVTEFVKALRTELEATFKEDINIYFDENPHDGLHAHHDVDDSLRKKLKCLVLIPVVSRTYCDEHSFAWVNEFKIFIEQARNDQFGLKVNVSGGNVASRVLPLRIHELDPDDISLFESEIEGVMRSIDFIYKESGVNRPLLPTHERKSNLENTDYGNQVNKVANAIREIILHLKSSKVQRGDQTAEKPDEGVKERVEMVKEVKHRNILPAAFMYLLVGLLLWKITDIGVDLLQLPSSFVRTVSISLVACFPIAMALAWLYERSPQGFVRIGSAASKKNLFAPHEKKPLTSNGYLAVLASTLLVLFIAFPKSIFEKETDKQPFAGKSLAILPFINLSQNPEEDYLSDGITEDIITQVSRISDLKVIARSSVLRYKKTEKDIVDIGRELDVETILEGTVRLSGDRARIHDTGCLLEAE
jgi:TolB-like protein